jgi:hypothetical protein
MMYCPYFAGQNSDSLICDLSDWVGFKVENVGREGFRNTNGAKIA